MTMRDGWISVEERLPESRSVVETKVMTPHGQSIMRQRLVHIAGHWRSDDGSVHVLYTPTHWQPIEGPGDE